ncbi:MAG: hypothetical protein A2052_08645 [Deltaproteobacteria bacterium GWA2_54_12]|nr:MAG: hypothetical protein A2052_08645 [Deltaproteobacteria bacterium GWA2_54_12]
MKRFGFAVIVALFGLSTLVACKKQEAPQPAPAPVEQQAAPEASPAPAPETAAPAAPAEHK